MSLEVEGEPARSRRRGPGRLPRAAGGTGLGSQAAGRLGRRGKLTYGDNDVTVVVRDDRRGRRRLLADDRLSALRERVGLYGGTLRAGPPARGQRLPAQRPPAARGGVVRRRFALSERSKRSLDVALALVLLAGSVAVALTSSDIDGPRWLNCVVLACSRCRWSCAASAPAGHGAVACSAGLVLLAFLTPPPTFPFATFTLMIASYSAGANAPRARRRSPWRGRGHDPRGVHRGHALRHRLPRRDLRRAALGRRAGAAQPHAAHPRAGREGRAGRPPGRGGRARRGGRRARAGGARAARRAGPRPQRDGHPGPGRPADGGPRPRGRGARRRPDRPDRPRRPHRAAPAVRRRAPRRRRGPDRPARPGPARRAGGARAGGGPARDPAARGRPRDAGARPGHRRLPDHPGGADQHLQARGARPARS